MNALVCLESVRPSRASRCALRLACELGEGARLVVLSAGGSVHSESLDLARRCAAVTRVVHLDDPSLEVADYFTLGMVLAEAARRLDASLVLTGESSDEEGQGLVPAALAHHLRAPLVSQVQAVRTSALCPDSVEVTLRAGGRLCRLFSPLPLVASVPASGTAARLAAERHPCGLEVLTLEQLGIDPSRLVFRPDLLGGFVPGPPAPFRHTTFDEAADLLLRRDP